ncbi:hypothetical protein HaLaN_29003, partial [Haematococcus lacustris]
MCVTVFVPSAALTVRICVLPRGLKQGRQTHHAGLCTLAAGCSLPLYGCEGAGCHGLSSPARPGQASTSCASKAASRGPDACTNVWAPRAAALPPSGGLTGSARSAGRPPAMSHKAWVQQLWCRTSQTCSTFFLRLPFCVALRGFNPPGGFHALPPVVLKTTSAAREKNIQLVSSAVEPTVFPTFITQAPQFLRRRHARHDAEPGLFRGRQGSSRGGGKGSSTTSPFDGGAKAGTKTKGPHRKGPGANPQRTATAVKSKAKPKESGRSQAQAPPPGYVSGPLQVELEEEVSPTAFVEPPSTPPTRPGRGSLNQSGRTPRAGTWTRPSA